MEKIKFSIKNMVRPNCECFEPYIAGKPIETIKRELGLKKVIKLASNENPLGPSPLAVSAIKKAVNKIYFYPDSNSFELKTAISRKFKLPCSMITLGAGSDEIIELIAKVFFHPADEIIISEHAFIRYQMAGLLMGCKLVTVPMNNYTHDLKAMAKAVNDKTKAVFIANPNNPTGTYNSNGELKAFLEVIKAKASGTMPLIVMDEAYYEYARSEKDYPETFEYLEKFPNLIILRTFSKIYGLAGLRIGYAFASSDIVDYIERVRPPFNINLLGQIAAAVSLEDKKQLSKSLSLVKQGKKYLTKEFAKMGIAFIPSAGNFILFDVRPKKGCEVFEKLLKAGVIVRAMDEYDYPNHVRVTIGTREENEYFIKSLKTIIK